MVKVTGEPSGVVPELVTVAVGAMSVTVTSIVDRLVRPNWSVACNATV